MLLLFRSTAAAARSRVSQIPDALLGTGKKILVLYNGGIRERVSTEGVPLVLVNGELRTLAAGETLQS